MSELKTIYKKRTKTKESNGISNLLQNSAKKKFLDDAYFFAVVNKAIDEIFLTEFPKLVEDVKLCEIFVKHSESEIKITVQSGDISFLTWLKTECGQIREKLMEILVVKKLIKTEEQISILIKRK
jgi:hypothetical protein